MARQQISLPAMLVERDSTGVSRERSLRCTRVYAPCSQTAARSIRLLCRARRHLMRST